MNINNYFDYNSMFQNYQAPVIPRVGVDVVVQQDNAKQLEEQNLNIDTTIDNHSLPLLKRNDTPLEDISLTFNKQDGFEYLGRDHDINALDMQKAISDMRKDDVLQQYQYFVGNSKDLYLDSPDGVVIRK